MPPLVTCIMPTANRRDFVGRAIELFVAQDYERKQLIIVEDGAENCESLTLGNEQIEYVHLGSARRTIGEKNNIACTMATGDLIAHFDDDDWHAPRRLSTQIAAMKGHRICGLDRLVYFNGTRAWLYQSQRIPWLAGGSLVYERSLWQQQRFEHKPSGADTAFIDAAYRRKVLMRKVSDPSLYVAMLHGRNNERKHVDPQWGGFDVNKVRGWLGERQAA